MISIAPEKLGERQHVLALNRVAFDGDNEARIIEALSRDDLNVLSLVALDDAKVVGHILFSRLDVEVDGRAVQAVALAPMAVLPEHQGTGIGSALVRRGLDLLTREGVEAVIVVGHEGFYPRFGFSPAAARHLASPFQGSEAFMALELKPGALNGTKGVCRYPATFGL